MSERTIFNNFNNFNNFPYTYLSIYLFKIKSQDIIKRNTRRRLYWLIHKLNLDIVRFRIMWRIVTFKKISYFILISIVTSILLFYSKQTNSQIALRGCRQESSRACWWLRKQELNENIARVCKKYGNFRDRISESSLVNRINFLHHGNMVNCIIQKVWNAGNDRTKYWSIFRQHPQLG